MPERRRPRTRAGMVVVGAGPAGLAAAREFVARGRPVTIVEQRIPGGAEVLGARALVPLLGALAKHHRESGDAAAIAALQTVELERRREAARAQLTHPLITLIEGEARCLDPSTMIVRLNDDSRKVSFRKLSFEQCLIAVGCLPALPFLPGLADTPFWTPLEAARCPSIPASLAVFGASRDTLVLAQAYARLGSRVELISPDGEPGFLLPEVRLRLEQALASDGVRWHRTNIEHVGFDGTTFTLTGSEGPGIKADRLLVATDNVPRTHSLCPEFAGIGIDEHGSILVDEFLRTENPAMLAAGRCIAPDAETGFSPTTGRLAARNMLGARERIDPGMVPWRMATDPPVCGFGRPEGRIHWLGTDRQCLGCCVDESGRICAAQAIGPASPEWIRAAQRAGKLGLSWPEASRVLKDALALDT